MELLGIYDNFGRVTDKYVVRGDKNVNLQDSEHIAVAIIFIENNDGEFLIQKTSKEKGGYYSSTGGHVNYKESPIECIKRECEEEIGLLISDEEIVDLGYLLYDKPLRFMFYVKKDFNIKDLKLQVEEVDFIEFMSVAEIEEIINNGNMLDSHVRVFKKVLEYKKDKLEKNLFKKRGN